LQFSLQFPFMLRPCKRLWR